MPLAEAIHKMTLLPAQKFGLAQRGQMASGMAADVVVLDMESLDDISTFQDPHQYPTGIAWVLVNGKVVVRRGKHTGAKPGKVLLRRFGG